MQYSVGSIVYFTELEVQVFVMTDADSNIAKLYGFTLLLSEYFTRLCATITRDEIAKNVLYDSLNNIGNYKTNLDSLVEAYGEYHKLENVKLRFGLSSEKPKKYCEYIVNYNLDGNCAPKFKPRGFGILGKNIEISSVTACLATFSFILEQYKEDRKTCELIKAAVASTAKKALSCPKIGFREELAIVKSVMDEMKLKLKNDF